MRHPAMRMTKSWWIKLIIAAWVLSGCAAPAIIQTESTASKVSPHALQATSAQTNPMMLHQPNSGSLWVENGSLGEMFINAKARRVGDIVTIKIVETSSASNQASTDTKRESSVDVGLNSLFNLEHSLGSESAFFNPFGPVGSTYGSEFGGSGKTARSGALTAYITARIIQLLPNGNLIIEGNREVRVNNENQVITLTGMVRSRDVSADNVIQSTYIADAKISYSGSGIANDQQRPGWLVRILDNVWPF